MKTQEQINAICAAQQARRDARVRAYDNANANYKAAEAAETAARERGYARYAAQTEAEAMRRAEVSAKVYGSPENGCARELTIWSVR